MQSFNFCLLNMFGTFPMKNVTNELKQLLLTKPGVHSSPLLRFRKAEFSHTFSDNIKSTENVWKTSNFVKSGKGLLCTPHLVYSFFKVIS